MAAVKKAPTKKASSKKAPVNEASAKKAPSKKAPAKKAPSKKVPSKQAPAEKAPAKQAPAVKAPAKKAPSKRAPAERAPAKKKVAAKQPGAAKAAKAANGAPKKHRVYGISFASVYPLYVQKAQNKGRTQAEVDEIIRWLTGYGAAQLKRLMEAKVDLETFFNGAKINSNASLIRGVVCGMRVEDITDPLMQKIRYLDKLIDELARGKQMASILRK